MVSIINSFRGMYFFLSNFYEAEVTYDGITYRNTEAAFQANKCADKRYRYQFSDLNPSQAKQLGRRVSLRRDWEAVKFDVMKGVVLAKFQQNPELAKKLIATGDAYLEEGNTWGDRTWGTVDGVGSNHLGKILMEVREKLRIDKVLQ